jgi:hypothetical protein
LQRRRITKQNDAVFKNTSGRTQNPHLEHKYPSAPLAPPAPHQKAREAL